MHPRPRRAGAEALALDKPNTCGGQRESCEELGGGSALHAAGGCQARRGICSSHGSDPSRVTEVATEVVCGLGEQPAS